MDNDGGHKVLSQDGIIVNHPQPIIIGNHVWIGSHVSILKNSNISDNSIIGYKSNVCGTEKYSTIVGNPAKVKKNGLIWNH